MTIVENTPTARRAPWARQRILDTATRLFREEGIHRTGVDRVIAEAGTTKSTLYKYFPRKSALIREYLRTAHERDVAAFENVLDEHPEPAAALRRIAQLVTEQLRAEDFRGCLYLNAAVETPDPSDEVRTLVQEHRDWYTAAMTELFDRLGHPLPGDAADEFMIARDGSMAGALTGDVPGAAAALHRVVERLAADAK